MQQSDSYEAHRERYSAAIHQAQLEGTDAFHKWFNKTENAQHALVDGYWDFAVHILTPKVCEYIHVPTDCTVLEIGYGGGRLLNAACSFFKEVIGIDIHEEQETVNAFLRNQGKTNFTLLKTSGSTIEVDSNSLDFVYSFIVLQHLPDFSSFQSYFQETYRCLKRGGVAQLYFGKYSRLSRSEQFQYWSQGYNEIRDAAVNNTSLVVRVGATKRLSRQIGFEILDTGTSYKNVPNGYPQRPGSQSYITLLKR
jgi:SAM-dependent methyltransferase